MSDLHVVTLKMAKPTIEFNHEQIEKELEESLKKYEGLTFTEETTTELRKTIAELNKGKKAVERYRIDIKKELNEPIKEFEDKCKSLNKRFDDVVVPLKQQLDDFVERERESKRKGIEQLIKRIVADYELDEKHASELVVENDMLAKSRSMKSIEDTLAFKASHLKTQQDKLETDKKLIDSNVRALNAEHGTSFDSQAYINLLEFEEIDTVLEKMKNHVLSEVKKREEESLKRDEELKKQEERLTSEEFEPIQEDVSFDEPEEIPFYDDLMPDPFADEERKVSYIVTANDRQHDKLVEVLFNLGVEWTADE